jgi:hypothetical protein
MSLYPIAAVTPTPLFFRLRSPEWKAVGLPCPSTSYELHKAGKLTLVKDAAGRTGITADEAQRFFSNVQPLTSDNMRDTSPAVLARGRRLSEELLAVAQAARQRLASISKDDPDDGGVITETP